MWLNEKGFKKTVADGKFCKCLKFLAHQHECLMTLEKQHISPWMERLYLTHPELINVCITNRLFIRYIAKHKNKQCAHLEGHTCSDTNVWFRNFRPLGSQNCHFSIMIKKNNKNTNMLFAFCDNKKNTDVINLFFSGASMRFKKAFTSKLLSEYLFKSKWNMLLYVF